MNKKTANKEKTSTWENVHLKYYNCHGKMSFNMY